MASISIIGGRVFIDGREVNGQTNAEPADPAQDELTTKTHVSMSESLALDVVTAEVTVNSGSEPGIRVDVEGPKRFVDTVSFRDAGDSLSVEEESPGGNYAGNIVVSNTSVVIGSFSSNSFGGSNRNGQRGKIRITVPEGTPVTLSGQGTSTTTLTMRTDQLRVHLSGQAELAVQECRRRVRAKLSGQTSVGINNGSLEALDVTVSGQSSFSYGGSTDEAEVDCSGQSSVVLTGTIGQARLNASGQSSITARGASSVRQHSSGMARIYT